MAKGELADQVIAELPDWMNSVIQLNGLIAERMGVVVSDFHGLHMLHRDGPLTGGALAERVGLTAGSASRMIDRLEAARCIRRIPDPHDRRRVLIEPTREGLDRVEAYYRGLTKRTRRDLSVFGEDELRSLLRFVEVASASTRAELDDLRAS